MSYGHGLTQGIVCVCVCGGGGGGGVSYLLWQCRLWLLPCSQTVVLSLHTQSRQPWQRVCKTTKMQCYKQQNIQSRSVAEKVVTLTATVIICLPNFMIKVLVLTRFKPVNLSHEVVFILLTRFKPANLSHEVVFSLLTRFKPVNLSHEVVFILLTRFKPVNLSHEVVFILLTRFKPVNLSHEVVFILLTRFKPVNLSHEVVFILTRGSSLPVWCCRVWFSGVGSWTGTTGTCIYCTVVAVKDFCGLRYS